MELLTVKDLTKTYESEGVRTEVLRGLSFEIKKGEFVSIIGPSGSGKSTLLHILGFLAEHTNGHYYFQGRSFSEYSDEEIAKVRNQKMGFVFQTFNLLGRNTVYENVRLPLIYSQRPESQWPQLIQEAVEQVGLSHRMNYQTLKLSGGEKQRVAIARALVNKPEVVFADEPTGNLDSVSGGVVMEILQDLNDRGHTVMLITHERSTAEHADRTISVLDGKINEEGLVKNKKLAKAGFSK